MRYLVLAFALLATPAFAQQPPPTPQEQALLQEIASCSWDKARYLARIGALDAELAKLKPTTPKAE